MKRAKTMALILSAAMVLSAGMAGSAENTVEKTIGGDTARILVDFENLEEGKLTEDGEEAFSDSNKELGIDIKIAPEGVEGSKGLVFGVTSAYTGSGSYVNATANPSAGPNKDVCLDGTTDIVLHIRCNETRGWMSTADFTLTVGEYDCDEDGNVVMEENKETGKAEPKITWRQVAADPTTVWYTMRDGEDEWEEQVGMSGAAINLPVDFEGYVKIPLTAFDPTWSTTDVNDQWDMETINAIRVDCGLYSNFISEGEDEGWFLVLDELGFIGDYEDVPLTKPEDSGEGEGTTTVPNTTTTTNKPAEGQGNQDNQEDPENPKTGENTIVLLGGAAALAVCAGAVLSVSRRRKTGR